MNAATGEVADSTAMLKRIFNSEKNHFWVVELLLG
jgi:hypothetical protein